MWQCLVSVAFSTQRSAQARNQCLLPEPSPGWAVTCPTNSPSNNPGTKSAEFKANHSSYLSAHNLTEL